MEPKQLTFYTAKVEELYQNLNYRILQIVIQRLAKGDRENISIPEWQLQKLSETGQLTKEVLAEISAMTDIAPKEIRKAIQDAGFATAKEVDDLMKGHRMIAETNPMKVLLSTYVNQAIRNLDNLINETLITRQGFGTVAQMYRDIINQTTAEALTGVATLDQALFRTMTKWAEKGVPSGFVDKAGRRWNIDTYAKASIKSTVNNVRNEVRRQRLADYDIHTVIVTSHPSARPACSHIQGHVVDLRPVAEIPPNSKYKSIYDPSWEAHYKEAGGHMGVNCHHMHIPFDPDINENNQVQYKSTDAVKQFEKEQGQRQRENAIRKTKMKLMVAKELNRTMDIKRLNNVLVKQNKSMVQYTRANDLKRLRKREQTKIPLKTLMSE